MLAYSAPYRLPYSAAYAPPAGSGGPDTTPDQFTFTDQTNVDLSATITSAPVTIAGIDAAADITISGGTYNINGGAYTSAAGTVSAGDQVRVRHTSSGSYGTVVNTTMTVGGVADVFSSTTRQQYDTTLANTLDDGYENPLNASWISANYPLCADLDSDGDGRGEGDAIAGFSFPAVALTTCSAATLTLNVDSEVSTGTFKVRAQSNAAAASSRWTSTNYPSNATAVAAEVTGVTTATGNKVLDVTTLVQQVMAGAAYAGGRINFWCEATDVDAACYFGGVGAGTAARLVIVS